MKKFFCQDKSSNAQTIYGLGMIGAMVFYIQNSTGLVGFFVAFFKGLVWPAFLVYDLLNFLY